MASDYGYRLPILFAESLLPIYQLFPYLALKLYWFLFYFCLYVDNYATVFIQFNRLTAVAFPLQYEDVKIKLTCLTIELMKIFYN
jgi:hypothetical protein